MMDYVIGKKYYSIADDIEVKLVHLSNDQVCVEHDDGLIEILPAEMLEPIKTELEKEYERVVEAALDQIKFKHGFIKVNRDYEVFLREVLPNLITAGMLNDPEKPIDLQKQLDGI